MERSYGTQYDASKTTKTVAAEFRAAVRAMVKAGTLPDAKYSVRYSAYTGGRSIDVSVTPTHDVQDWLNIDWLDAHARQPHRHHDIAMYSPFACAVIKTLEGMLGAHNHDGSDSQTDYYDVKFYACVQLRLDGAGTRLTESRRDAIATGQGDERVQPMSEATRAVVEAARAAVRRVVVKRETAGSLTYWTIAGAPVTPMLGADVELAKLAGEWFDGSAEAAAAARRCFPKALIAVK